MNTHLSSDELYKLVFDQIEPADAGHLADCALCRQQVEELKRLATDLTIARLSQPSSMAIEQYRTLFAFVQKQPSPIQRAVQQIRAVLTWDSRQQPALQGVRSGGANAYRQLYTAGEVEIELMIEQVGRLHRIEGDLIDGRPEGNAAPALVELVDQYGVVRYGVESSASGLFRLEHVAAGVYRATITRVDAPMIEVDALEVA